MSPPPDFSGASDQDVVAWARQGREEGYRELLRRYERPVLALIYRIVREHELAKDLAQETFVKVFQALDSHGPQRNLSAWILSIANHVAIDHLRRKQLDTLPLEDSPMPARPGRSRRRRWRRPAGATPRRRTWTPVRSARRSNRPFDS